jgi:hypothetical protein
MTRAISGAIILLTVVAIGCGKTNGASRDAGPDGTSFTGDAPTTEVANDAPATDGALRDADAGADGAASTDALGSTDGLDQDAAPPTGPLEPAPTKVHVDLARGVDVTVDATGGQASTTGADGTVYTLVVPAGAVVDATTLRLEPFTRIDGVPFAGGLAAGFHLSPAGSLFARPVRVAMTLPSGTKTDDLSGFCYDGDDVDAHLCPFELTGTTLTFSFAHFSGGGAGHGDVTLTPTGTEAAAVQMLASYLNQQRRQMQPLVAADVADLLQLWYDGGVKPGLVAARTTIEPMPAFREWQTWRQLVTAGPWDTATATALRTALAAPLEESPKLAAQAIKGIIADANSLCRTDADLKHARSVMFWQSAANLYGIDSTINQLDLPYVLANLCVAVQLPLKTFPTMVAAGQSATLALKVGYWVNEGTPLFDQPMRVTVTASGTMPPGTRSGPTDADGQYSTSYVRESDGVQLELDVKACFAERALRKICASTTIVRGATSPTLEKYKNSTFLDRTGVVNVPADVRAGTEWKFFVDPNTSRILLNLSSVPGNGFTYLGAQMGVTSASGDAITAQGSGYDVTAHFEVRADGTFLIGTNTRTIAGTPPEITKFDVNVRCETCP